MGPMGHGSSCKVGGLASTRICMLHVAVFQLKLKCIVETLDVLYR